jgi:hypothetical protein
MEKYRLVHEHKGDGDELVEEGVSSEVRITQQGKPRNYISYAMTLFVSALVARHFLTLYIHFSPSNQSPQHVFVVGRIQYDNAKSHG